MSRHYLIPVKFKCDSRGCTAEAMGHERFKLSGKGKLEQDYFARDELPEGWERIAAVGECCPTCVAADKATMERLRNGFQTAIKVEVAPPAPDPKVQATVAKAAEAVKQTAQLSGTHAPSTTPLCHAECVGCEPCGDCPLLVDSEPGA